jgi:Salmonella virulence plasmid 28.1kDa A protein
LPAAIPTSGAALSTFPNYDNLFQAGDACYCEDCRSVLSPAAYFADILMFLRDRKAKNPASSVKDVLFARRPDLAYLELNCDNALTPLPYVDIVCEVLERAIADGTSDVELTGFGAVPANPAAAKAAVAAARSAAKLSAGTDIRKSSQGSRRRSSTGSTGFLRMWRKLDGWKAWELDLVIHVTAVGAGNLDEPFLVNLYFFDRRKARLGARATVSQVAALFGMLDIGTHFAAAYKPRQGGRRRTLRAPAPLPRALRPGVRGLAPRLARDRGLHEAAGQSAGASSGLSLSARSRSTNRSACAFPSHFERPLLPCPPLAFTPTPAALPPVPGRRQPQIPNDQSTIPSCTSGAPA